jgi:hypothetical protein
MRGVLRQLGAVLLFGLSACGELDLCENDVSQRIVSPSGQRTALVFARDCGATTGFNTHLSLLSGDEKLPSDVGGNAFVYGKHLPLRVEWISDTELRVSGSSGVDAIKRKRRVDGVDIRYVD